jgi:poly(3-hydroxybutyrate) depolymerase
MKSSTRSFVVSIALSASLCPTVAHAAWETVQLEGMSVEIYTPATTSPIGSGHGLMLVLHGCAQTGAQLREYGNFETTAEDFGMVVAVPTVANGGVIAGCWDYYGPAHSRDAGDPSTIIGLAEGLRDDASRSIDPAQVYLVGFSSGGAEALIGGCLAPDVFAGVAVSAGPALGTTLNEIGSIGTTADEAAMLCTLFAATHAADFATQLAITFTDTMDFTVAQGYAQVNTDMFEALFANGGELAEAPIDVATLPGTEPTGSALAYADADGERIAFITSTGVGHNFPSGSGAMGPALSYVAGNGLNLSYFAAEMFTTNNRRVEGGFDPTGDTGGDTGSDESGDDGGESGGESSGAGGESSGGAEDGSDGGGDEEPGGVSAGFADDHVAPSGCQCRSAPRPTDGSSWLALALPALLRRRRSR